MADIVQAAKSQIGNNEKSGSADKYTRWYYGNSKKSSSVPWCAIFVSWCAKEAGILNSKVPKFASCDSGKGWFSGKGLYKQAKGYGGSYKPSYGDVIFFSGKYTQRDSTHVGIVSSADGSKVYTVEGNTSNSVRSRSYSLSSKYILGYGLTGIGAGIASGVAGGIGSIGSGGGSSGSGGSGGSGGGAKEESKVEITSVSVKSVTGAYGAQKSELLNAGAYTNYGNEILIQNDKTYSPCISGDIVLEYDRKGSPGTLKFDVVMDRVINITEGNAVRFRRQGKNVFYGYIFTKDRKDNDIVSVTCYDQLRYLKNEDTIAYKNKRYSDLLKQMAAKYNLKLGTVEQTPYVIPQQIEEGALIDMLLNASDLTVLNTGKLYVLYDDFGKLCLRNIESMMLPILVDKDSAQGFSYSSSIDKDVYNSIILAKDNDQTGVREVHVTNGTETQKSWGILTYYENLDNADSKLIKEKSKTLLKYYNKKQRQLSVEKNYGDLRVRGGSSVIVKLDLGDIKVQNYMVVEKVKHVFADAEYTMDLTLSGIRGEFNV